jgi:4-hydroxyphenylpyruvate dioxygenase
MENDFLPIRGTDHIELYVGNAKQSALFYQHCMGFDCVGYAGPETGVRDRCSYVLQQNKIRLVLTTSLFNDSVIAEHVKKHGDGVKVLALWVDDAQRSFSETITRGAEAAMEPVFLKDNFAMWYASIKTYGETVHTFVERRNYNGIFLPGFRRVENSIAVLPIGLKHIDHCVGNVELGQMNRWVDFYEQVMGFKLLVTFDDTDISTEYSALMSGGLKRQWLYQIPD